MTSKGFATLLDAAKAVGLTENLSKRQSIVDKAERDELAIIASDDPLMAAAMRKARATLAEFLALASNPSGSGELQPLANFTTNPAGAAVVNTVGPIRQIVDSNATSLRRFLVVAPLMDGKVGTPIQIQQ
jgi:hypothetical protein